MTGLLAVKLRRDLRASWSRLLLMAVAIAVSLTAFGAVLFAWTGSARETRAAYLSTRPASATILLDRGIGGEDMAALAERARTRPGVADAVGRTQFTGDVHVDGKLSTIPLQVFAAAPDDPLGLARFFPDRLAWPPAPGEIHLARDSLALLGVEVGDTVTVRTPDGGQAPLRIVDTVYDPALSPSPQEQTARGYLTPTWPGALLDQVKIQVDEPASADRDRIAAVATDLARWLRDQGVGVREVQVPEPGEHPHQWQADALLAALLAGGAAALLLSAVLVAVMLNTLFARQIPQIGIMKAVGATTGRIAGLATATTLVVAATATALALGPAVLLGRSAVGLFLGFLGVRAAELGAPWWTYALVVALGLGLPPLMALRPLLRTARTTVRAAIDHSGAPPSPATGLVTRLGRLRLDRGLLMAVRNTVRRPARFALSTGLLAVAGTVFMAGMSLSTSVEAVTEERVAETTWDVDVQLADPVPADRVATALAGVPGVTAVDQLGVFPTAVAVDDDVPITRTYPDQGHGRVSLTAIPAGATTVAPPDLLEGRWLDPGETGAVVLNQVTRENSVPDVRTGQTVTLVLGGRTTTWRVVGVVEEVGHGAAVYTTTEGLTAAGRPALVTTLRATTAAHDESSRDAAATAIRDALAAAGIEVRAAASVSRGEAISAGHLGPVVLILLGIALPLGVVGFIGVASTMSANVLDRTKEFGILHAIGARPATVRRTVAAEGVLLAVAGTLVAIPLALVLAAVLGAGLGDLFLSAPLPYRVSPTAMAAWLAVAVVGAVLATDAAATRAARTTVREALADTG